MRAAGELGGLGVRGLATASAYDPGLPSTAMRCLAGAGLGRGVGVWEREIGWEGCVPCTSIVRMGLGDMVEW